MPGRVVPASSFFGSLSYVAPASPFVVADPNKLYEYNGERSVLGIPAVRAYESHQPDKDIIMNALNVRIQMLLKEARLLEIRRQADWISIRVLE